ncbi:general transcription factor II-I repeat domain-containing protein 2-like [Centruroides vittatus]|uniref:general transcription factor II-I repeat domain-containing protein 2-like n=1 Tax=Centruroides vittatus TaxID=120091 RepID=UPI00350EC364
MYKSSYLIAEKLAQKDEPLIVGKLIKECIIITFHEYCPEKVNLFNKTSLSHQTIRRIDDIADGIVSALQTQLSKRVYYSLALDEITDQSDTVRLIIFIREIDVNFNIIEETLNLCYMNGTTLAGTYLGTLI